jgi:TolB protein
MASRLLVLLTLLAVLAVSGTAHATFAGEEGRLLFNRYDAASETLDLYSANPDGSDLQQLTDYGPDASAIFSDWSPDGSLIAFDSNVTGDVRTYVMQPDGSQKRPLTRRGFTGDAAWFPNGRRLAIEADWGQFPKLAGIWVIPYRESGTVGRGKAFRVTRVPAGREFDSEPQVRPDGRWIAFTRFDSRGESAVFRVRVNGTREQRLTDWAEGASAPDYSPDGTRIVYDTHDSAPQPNLGHIRVMAHDGTNKTTVVPGTETAFNQNPVFSPTGEHIAYSVFPLPQGDPQIYVANADGSAPRLVLAAPGSDNKVEWRSSGG